MLDLYIIDCANKHVLYYGLYVIALSYILFEYMPFYETLIFNQPPHNSLM